MEGWNLNSIVLWIVCVFVYNVGFSSSFYWFRCLLILLSECFCVIVYVFLGNCLFIPGSRHFKCCHLSSF